MHLNTFSNVFIVAVHYTHNNTCYVLLVLLTAPRVVKIIKTYHILLLCSPYPYKVSYSLLQEIDNIAQEKTTAYISEENQLQPPKVEVTVDTKITPQRVN